MRVSDFVSFSLKISQRGDQSDRSEDLRFRGQKNAEEGVGPKGTAQRLASLYSALKPGIYALADHRALELGKRSRHLKHQATGWRRGVNRLLVEVKIRISEKVEKRITEQLQAGKGVIKVAKEIGVGVGTVQRVAVALRPFEVAA